MNTGRQPDTVRSYLDALTGALRVLRCPAGLISDAVSDAEEHLNNEIATHPEQSEAEILASVIETYGTPEEIAEEYKSMEATLSGPFPKSDEPERRHYGFFGAIRDPRAYGALLYMFLSLITGIFYFIWTLVTGLLTLIFSCLFIGIPLIPAYFGSVRVLGHIEGRIVESLLGTRMPRRLPASGEQTFWARIGTTLTDAGNWSSMIYLLFMLPFGILYFVIATVATSLSLGLIGGGIAGLVSGESHVRFDDAPWLEHLFSTAPGLLLCAVVGFILFFITLNLAKGIGWLHGLIAEVLLVRL